CIRAIVGQQISVAGAITIVGRLVERYGVECDLGAGVSYAFPSSKKLAAELELEHLAMPRARAQAILNLCQAYASGVIDFDLMSSAELMHEPDIMPMQDLVLQKMLVPGERLTAQQLSIRSEAWRPWRAYATLHLWQLAND
ncbi:MAG: hypothetical protein NZ738_07680, partial [Oceanospirillaceae bacterium]|nr:hypothetical protein [Oceanospirillaceae bacterium]